MEPHTYMCMYLSHHILASHLRLSSISYYMHLFGKYISMLWSYTCILSIRAHMNLTFMVRSRVYILASIPTAYNWTIGKLLVHCTSWQDTIELYRGYYRQRAWECNSLSIPSSHLCPFSATLANKWLKWFHSSYTNIQYIHYSMGFSQGNTHGESHISC